MKKVLIITLVVAAAACSPRRPQPVNLEAADMCSRCKMAISEKRYAAELVARDQAVFKFDDIGCMLRFARQRGLEDNAAAWFVMDYDGQGWLDAERAHYVKSEVIHSPMGGGLLAVKDRSKAEQYANKYGGRTLTFDDLWK